jgi:hypothetical protein
MICPRKWAVRLGDATALLRSAIENGYFVYISDDGRMPYLVWARDPDDADLVYEAKLTEPPNGYKAYPLTPYQARYDLPFRLP